VSSILKALRRLEEERARKSSVAPEIAVCLLRDGGRRRTISPWIWPGVIAGVTAMVAALLWSWRPAPFVKQIATPVLLPATISSATNAGRGGAVIIEEVMDPRRPVLLPAAAPVATPELLPVKVNPSQPRRESQVSPVKEDKPAAILLEERQRPVISAIAWQDDSSARMAVVDGLPVMTGEFVGTAKVQEILRDRILFEEAGKLFTVFVDPQ
jgi:general secretion pathway protein B